MREYHVAEGGGVRWLVELFCQIDFLAVDSHFCDRYVAYVENAEGIVCLGGNRPHLGVGNHLDINQCHTSLLWCWQGEGAIPIVIYSDVVALFVFGRHAK